MSDFRRIDHSEAELSRALTRMPLDAAWAFGALAAERIVSQARIPVGDDVRALLDGAWTAISDPASVDAQILAQRARALVPDEDSTRHLEDLVKGNAAAAVAYVLQAVAEERVEPVIWAARQAREAAEVRADWARAPALGSDHPYEPVEWSDEVRREVERQRADLLELERCPEHTGIERLRKRIDRKSAD